MKRFIWGMALFACSSPAQTPDAGADATVDVVVANDSAPDAPNDAPADAPTDGSFTCTLPSDCASLVCMPNGTCVDASTIAYVDNKNGTCIGTHAGTLADPFCDITSGLTKAIVHVAGSSTTYAGFAITTTVWIVGPGNVLPDVKIAGAAPLVTVTGSGNAKLEGLELVATGAGAAVSCSNATATLALARDRIHDSGLAVSAQQCTISIDATQIGPANMQGIALLGATYAITNTFVVKNGPANVATISINANANGTFSHNTVVANATTFGVPAIACSATAHVFSNSILVQNTQYLGTQFSGTCTHTYDDVDDAALPPGTGNRNVGPSFVSPATADYHLNTPNVCCIDQIPKPDAIDHDFDGRARPVNAKWDIGAHEHP